MRDSLQGGTCREHFQVFSTMPYGLARSYVSLCWRSLGNHAEFMFECANSVRRERLRRNFSILRIFTVFNRSDCRLI